MRRICVIGGGVAGISTAWALIRAGYDGQLDIFEKDSQSDVGVVGAGILLMPECMETIAGVDPEMVAALYAAGHVILETEVVSSSEGRTTATVRSNESHSGHHPLAISRKRLRDVLMSDLSLHTRGTTAIVRSESGFHCSIAVNKTSGCFDVHRGTQVVVEKPHVIVGADGLASAVRRKVFPLFTEQKSPVRELVSTCSLSPELDAAIPRHRLLKIFCSEKSVAIGVLRTSEVSCTWFIQFPSSAVASVPCIDYKQLAIRLVGSREFGSDRERNLIRGLVESTDFETSSHLWTPMTLAEPFPSPVFSLPRKSVGEVCSEQQIVLIGDAWHPVLPFSSQGTPLAIEDAITLARALLSSSQPESTSICSTPPSTATPIEDASCRPEDRNLQHWAKQRWDSVRDVLNFGRQALCEFLKGNGPTHAQCYRRYQNNVIPGSGNDITGESGLFAHENVNLPLLRERAYNLRWATVSDDTIPLTAADPDFPACQPIRDAICTYANAGYFSYGPSYGVPELREKLAEMLRARKGYPAEISADSCIITNSAAAALYTAVASVLSDPNDEAIIMDPVDFLFESSIRAAGANPVRWPVPDTVIGPDRKKDAVSQCLMQLQTLVTSSTKLIMVCSPHNPLGRTLPVELQVGIVEFARQYDLQIISDEVWSDIIYPESPSADDAGFVSMVPRDPGRTIAVYGFSKSFGIAGLRIGAIVTMSPRLLHGITSTGHFDATADGASTLSQIGAAAALSDGGFKWQRAFLEHLRTMRDYAVERVSRIPGLKCNVPDATFVLWINVTSVAKDTGDLVTFLREQHAVSVVPGLPRWFGPGARGHIRISYATSHSILREALDRLAKGVAAYVEERKDIES